MVCCSPGPHSDHLPVYRKDRDKGESAYSYKLFPDIYIIGRSGEHIAKKKGKNALLPDPQLISDYPFSDRRFSAGQQPARERRRIERCKLHSVRKPMRLCS